MSKQEYMHDLWEALNQFGAEVRDEIVEDYEEHFADGLEQGKSEEQIIKELGSVDELVKELKSLKNEDVNTGNGSADFEKKKESFNNFTKSFASAIGSLAAAFTSEAEKFVKAASEGADSFGDYFSNMGEKVASKSTEFANEVKDSFTSNRGDEKSSEKAEASEEKNDAYSGKGVKNLILEACCGNIDIKESGDGQFHVFYKNFGSVNQRLIYHFDFSQKDDTAYVSIKKEPGVTNFFKSLTCPRIEVIIEMPPEFNEIKARTLAGNIKCENIKSNNIDVNTMAGNVEFTNVNAADIVANTMAGNVKFDENSARSITSKTNAGNLDVRGTIGVVKAVSNAGNVKLLLRGVSDINASTTAGNIRIALPDATGYNVDTQTPAGNIKLVYKDSEVKGNRIGNYTMGDGSVVIKARTAAGNIEIKDND